MNEPSQCPHPLCSRGLSSLASFREHCNKEHGLLAPEMKLGANSVALSADMTSSYGTGDDTNDACGHPDAEDPADSVSADEGTPYDSSGNDSDAHDQPELADPTDSILADNLYLKNGLAPDGGVRFTPQQSEQSNDNVTACARPDVTQLAPPDVFMAFSRSAMDVSNPGIEVENEAEPREIPLITSSEAYVAASFKVSAPRKPFPPRFRPLTPHVSTTGSSTSFPKSPQHLRKAYVCEFPSWADPNVACMKVCRDKYALRRHCSAHAKKEKLVCEWCGLRCSKKPSLQRHLSDAHQR